MPSLRMLGRAGLAQCTQRAGTCPLARQRGLSSQVSKLDDVQRREFLQPLIAKGWVHLPDRDAIQKRFMFQVLSTQSKYSRGAVDHAWERFRAHSCHACAIHT